MTFLDARRGWITEYCDQATTPFLYRTTDGGHPWYPQPLPGIQTHQEITLSSVVFLDRSFGVLTVSQGTLTVYVTSDGGATWNAAAQVPGGSDVRPVPISPQHWVLASGPDQLTVITNGRATTIQADFGPQGVRQLWFGDALHGLVITGDGRFLRTDDGGHTWQPVNVEH
jgi:photosystem II stability/assembly factor-like uncharacterized protein